MGFGKTGKGVIITHADIVTLGTLASNELVKQASPITIGEDFRLIKVEIAGQIVGLTDGDLPLHLYLFNDELSVTEIEECITNAGPTDRNDRLQAERAERAVFLLGTFSSQADTQTEAQLYGADGQQGVVNKTIRWTFSDPEGWGIGVFNQSGAGLQTGAVFRFVSKFFGVWVT